MDLLSSCAKLIRYAKDTAKKDNSLKFLIRHLSSIQRLTNLFQLTQCQIKSVFFVAILTGSDFYRYWTCGGLYQVCMAACMAPKLYKT